MKSKLSQAHLKSNRNNGKLYGHLGGAAYATKMAELKDGAPAVTRTLIKIL